MRASASNGIRPSENMPVRRRQAVLRGVYCINHPWLTTIDWPVSAFDGNAVEKNRYFGHVLRGREFAVEGFTPA